MPPVTTAKSPRSKKNIIIQQKPKGAVRAKSGCYTCRIRRKKCDEKRMGGHEDGPCETCFRLKLECLGFGAKRPEWLRENSRVSSIRDRIKAHLAAQGMIKGHAGSGSRSAVQEEFLRLSDHRDDDMPYRTGGSSSSSDGSPTREESVDSDRPYGARLTLSTSAMRGMYDPRYDDYPVHSDIHSRCDSPVTGSSIHEFEPAEIWPQFSISLLPSEQIPFELVNNSMQNYVRNVVKIQYLLGDRNVLPTMIWDAIKTHADSHEAVNLLAKAYYGRQSDAHFSVLQDFTVVTTIRSLKGSLESKGRFTADDAMAALHIVSLYLFDGGRGKWDDFIFFASRYVKDVLENPNYYNNYPAALEAASAKEQFVVKTTIWFDVLAAVTTQQPPHLLSYIRELFKPDRSYVGTPPTYSMLSPMGCENVVVWALAETAYLAYWKRRHEEMGELSVRELVQKVQEIEAHLQPGPRPERPQPDSDSYSRFVASEIFRTATRLFLKSVESGDYPHVLEIRECVNETYDAIMQFPLGLSALRPAIVRSTVFGIFMCGSLSDDRDQRRMLRIQLQQHSGHEGVGNCTTVSTLLDELWANRDVLPPNHPVQWRQYLNKAQILLV
ncbi:fungal-specific transcription factor domain-containing protein [Flammula alnicola]|nr:fungal-specific transcription factor domain-containing protein [Flammula alnicola]